MMSEPTIIYEDASILVINKPSLMHSVNTKDGSANSVASWISEHYPALISVSPKKEDCGISNRLDFETSGLLIAAKDADVYQILSERTKKLLIHKTYLAYVEGVFNAQATVDKAIGARGRTSNLVRIFENPRSKDRALPAITKFFPVSVSNSESIVGAQISQGRRHQIRVHAKSIGHPLVGDTKYGSLRGGEFLLHSWKIMFPHPITDKNLELLAPIPESFVKLRKQGVWRDFFENVFS